MSDASIDITYNSNGEKFYIKITDNEGFKGHVELNPIDALKVGNALVEKATKVIHSDDIPFRYCY